MDYSELSTFVEGKTLEFKRDLSSPKGLMKTLVTFANTAGGKVIIGVDDKTKKLVGVKNPLDEEARLCSLIRIAFFDDRIEIENPGILLPGMTIEDMKQGVSKIRNPVIARVFRELELIEQWGSGVRRMFREAKEQRLPEPEIIEIGMRVRFIVRLAEFFPVEKTTVHAQRQPDQPTQQVTLQVTQQVTYLLKAVSGEMSRNQLMAALALKDRVNFSRTYLEPALSNGLLEMTQPESPRSPTQRYRLTEKGKAVLAAKEGHHGS